MECEWYADETSMGAVTPAQDIPALLPFFLSVTNYLPSVDVNYSYRWTVSTLMNNESIRH